MPARFGGRRRDILFEVSRAYPTETPCGSVHENPVRGQRTRPNAEGCRTRKVQTKFVSTVPIARAGASHRDLAEGRKLPAAHCSARRKVDVEAARLLTTKRELDCRGAIHRLADLSVYEPFGRARGTHGLRQARRHHGCYASSQDLCELKRDYHSDVWTAAGYERRGDTKTAGFPDLLDLPGLQALRGPQDLQARWARPDPKGDPGEAAKQ